MLFFRNYRLSIDIGNVRKTYEAKSYNDALKIDFEIDMSAGGTFSKGTITMMGLKKNDIIAVATNRNKDGSMKKSNIQLELGYDSNLSQVLKGNITDCEANLTTPDYYLRMEIMTGYNENIKEVSDAKKKATFRDACQIAAANNGLKLQYDNSIENKEIGNYSYRGKPSQQIRNLRTYNPDVIIAVVNGTLQVTNKEKTQGVKKYSINSKNGMIGDVEITNYGVNARTLLNPAFKINDLCQLESIKAPQINGLYRIMELKHRGTNRGDIWESFLILQKR